MPRAVVSRLLSETLRSIRLQNKIQTKQVATHIGKSSAFISKLENNTIRTIDAEELNEILQFISINESQEKLADQIYNSLKIKYSTEEIKCDLWFYNYYTIECMLPVPGSLIDDINSRIERLDISRQYLTKRINANEAISEVDRNNESIPYNQWYKNIIDGNYCRSIKIFLPDDKLNSLLDKKTDIVQYIFIFCILYYLIKIERYGDTVNITFDENTEIWKETTDILNNHSFFTIFEKQRLISEKKTQDEVKGLLNSFDNENVEIINDILHGFHFATEHNIKTTNIQLQAFRENMHWDLGFMLKLISMDFSNLYRTSISNRKNLLSEIEELVKQFSELPEDQNRIETY